MPMPVPIFATPFAVASVQGGAELNPRLAALFLSRATENYRDPALPHDPLCFRSREEVFEWHGEVVGQLQRAILAAVCTAVQAASEHTEAEFAQLRVQARARFALVHPNGCLPAATAPMASWYALYCVTAPPAVADRTDSAALRVYAIRHGTMFKDAVNWRLRPPYGDSHYLWRPVAGQVAIFPAAILHEVALNRSQADLVLVMVRVRFVEGAQGGEGGPAPW